MPIRMADGNVLSAMYKGDLPMTLQKSGSEKTSRIVIPNVYYHERFDANLLSWGSMRRDGWELHSSIEGTYLITPKGMRVDASTRGGLTTIEDRYQERVYGLGSVVCATAQEVIQLHRRLGHVSWSRLVDMSASGTCVGIPDLRRMSDKELSKAEKAIKECRACAAAKMHRKALGHRGLDKGSRPGEVLHMDTFYAIVRDATSGKKKTEYCLLASDAYTEFKWCDPKSSPAELPYSVIDIIQHSHTLTGRYPRLVIADLGSEFENKTVKEFARKNGIQVQPSPARAKELNGLSEKMVDTTKNHVRAMLLGAGMPHDFGWRYGIQHFVYMWNRTHVGRRTGVTPYQALTSREPSIMNAGEFGCDVYVHQHRSLRDTTFGPKAEPAIYLGHNGRLNCPVVRMVHSGKVIMCKDVHFREGSFSHLRAAMKGTPEDIRALDLSADLEYASEQKYDDDETDEEELEPVNRRTQPKSPPTEEQYDVDAITDSRTRQGVKEYRVKWTGHSELTWEPADVLSEDAPDAVQEYEDSIANRAQTWKSRTRSGSRSASASAPSPSDADEEEDEDSESPMRVAAAYAARCL